ncbi:hypothetical protein KO465_02380 [Candidatus Micrarchaeota archaeon]|nr:hypothetical protein [Candidatus Micrarchaeota archaeon]
MGFGDPLESDAKQLLNSEQGNLLDFFLGLPLVFIIYIILHFKKHNFSLNQIIKNTFAFIASIFLLIYVILPKYLLSWAFFNDRFIPFFILFSSIFFRSKKIDNVLYVLLIFSFVYLFLILETTSPKNLPELPIYDGPAIMLLSTESMYLHKVANSQNICFISDLFFASGSNSHYILIYDDELTFQHSIRERLNPKNCTLVSEKIEQNMMHYEDLKYIITADMCDVAENFQHWDVITTPDSNTDNLFVFENPNYTKTEK